MADKKLTIAADAKVSPSVQKLLTTMEQLTAAGTKMSKAMQVLSGGGAPGTGGPGTGALAQGGLAKSLLAQQKLFDSLGASGSKLAKVLNEQVTAAQTKLQKAMKANTDAMIPLQKQYEALGAMAGRMGPNDLIGRRYIARRQAGVGARLASGLALQSEMAGALGELTTAPEVPGVGGRGGGGGGGGGGGAGGNIGQMVAGMAVSRMGVPMGGTLMAMGGGAAIAAVAAAAVILAGKAAVINAQGMMPTYAEMGGQESQRFAALRDVKHVYGRAMMADPSKTADIRPDTGARSAASFARAFFPAMGSVLTSIPNASWMGGEGWWKTVQTKLRATSQGMSAERAKELGDALGGLGDVTQGHLAGADARLGMDWRYGAGTFERASALESRYGVARGAAGSYMGALSNRVGTYGSMGYAERVMQLQRQGMDPGRAAGILGASAVAGGNVFGASAAFDPTVRAIMGEAATSTMGAGSAMWTGKGDALSAALANSVSTGYGPQGVRQAEAAAMGAGLLGQRAGGNDPYQKSFNVAAASSVLGADASPYIKNFLATQLRDPAVLADILDPKRPVPPHFANMGITKTQAVAMARAVDRSGVGARWIDTEGNSPAEKQMRAFRQAGGVAAWGVGKTRAQRLEAAQVAGGLYAQVHADTGGEVGAGTALLQYEMGVGSAPAGAAGRRGPQTETQKAAAAKQTEDEKLLGKLLEAKIEAMKLETETSHKLAAQKVLESGQVVTATEVLGTFIKEIQQRRADPFAPYEVTPP